VIGGGIAIGLLLGRLLRSAAPIDQPPGNGSTYGRTRTSTRSMTPTTRSTGYNGGRPSDVGDAGTSIVASTTVVEAGSAVDTGSTRRSTR
jgi:hypothetical protein